MASCLSARATGLRSLRQQTMRGARSMGAAMSWCAAPPRRPRSPDAGDPVDADLPMIRWLLWIAGGLMLGGIVHLATIMMLPRTASRGAYARLAPVVPVNGFAVLPAPTPESWILL